MADQDAAPLTDAEREELEALREEKARREQEKRDRRDRAELEALRAEQKKVDDEILAERAAEEARVSSKHAVASAPSEPARHASTSRHHEHHEQNLTFGQKMVQTPEAKGDDDVPGMAPAQKIVILLALLFVITGAVYVITR